MIIKVRDLTKLAVLQQLLALFLYYFQKFTRPMFSESQLWIVDRKSVYCSYIKQLQIKLYNETTYKEDMRALSLEEEAFSQVKIHCSANLRFEKGAFFFFF